MPNKSSSINLEYLVLRYVSGESEKALAESLGISRYLIRKRLTEAGVPIRGRSEAMYARMARTPPKQRDRLTAAAHDAARQREQPLAEREARARTRESRIDGRVSPAELQLAEMLRAEGHVVTHQKAVGKYNVDLAANPVAVEILGGSWHRARRHGERLRYLLDHGWDVIFIWVNRTQFPLGSGAAEYVISHLKFRESDPSAPRCYRVIRGTGQFIAGGSADDDDIPDVVPYSDLPHVPPAEVPFGFCHCGCGRKTTIPTVTNNRCNRIKGQPMRYISGHNRSRNSR